MLLGDISMEAENFEAASSDFSDCLRNLRNWKQEQQQQQQTDSSSSSFSSASVATVSLERRIATALFSWALALEYVGHLEQAMSKLSETQECMQALAQKMQQSSESKQDDIDDLMAICEDIDAKMKEIQTKLSEKANQPSSVAQDEAFNNVFGQPSVTASSSSAAAAAVTDLSGMVKSKKGKSQEESVSMSMDPNSSIVAGQKHSLQDDCDSMAVSSVESTESTSPKRCPQ